MGGGQSRENWEDDDDGVCKPCFLFRAPMPASRTISDPMGSPLPETPMVDRRKREAAITNIQEDTNPDPVYSSQYFGIEKEVDANASQDNPSSRAVVHEGKVSLTIFLPIPVEDPKFLCFM